MLVNGLVTIDVHGEPQRAHAWSEVRVLTEMILSLGGGHRGVAGGG